MGFLQPLETALGGLFNQIPMLPVGFRVWLARAAWWLTIIGLVASVLAALGFLFDSLLVTAVVSPACSYDPAACAATGGATLWLWLSFIVTIIRVGIYALAITPLKNMSKRGWDLLFLSALLTLVEGVVALDAGAIVGGVIGTAIVLYVLYGELPYFTGTPLPAGPTMGAMVNQYQQQFSQPQAQQPQAQQPQYPPQAPPPAPQQQYAPPPAAPQPPAQQPQFPPQAPPPMSWTDPNAPPPPPQQ